MTKDSRPKVAIVYDADKTILTEDHPNLILRARGIDPDDFWKEIMQIEATHKKRFPDSNTDGFYVNYMAEKSKDPNHRLYGLTIEEMEDIARKDMSSLYYPGIPEFFQRIKDEHPDCDITHNIVSLGNHHMLEASLGEYIDRIFAYTFMNDVNGGVISIGSNSSLEKDSATKKISRGGFYGTEQRGFEYPMQNMIALGDGASDKEMFRQVAPRGRAICVFDSNRYKGAMDQAIVLAEKIGNVFIAPADYRPGKSIDRLTKETLDRAE